MGEFDSAAGGGQQRKKELKAAVTRGYAGLEIEEDDDDKYMEMTFHKTGIY